MYIYICVGGWVCVCMGVRVCVCVRVRAFIPPSHYMDLFTHQTPHYILA